MQNKELIHPQLFKFLDYSLTHTTSTNPQSSLNQEFFLATTPENLLRNSLFYYLSSLGVTFHLCSEKYLEFRKGKEDVRGPLIGFNRLITPYWEDWLDPLPTKLLNEPPQTPHPSKTPPTNADHFPDFSYLVELRKNIPPTQQIADIFHHLGHLQHFNDPNSIGYEQKSYFEFTQPGARFLWPKAQIEESEATVWAIQKIDQITRPHNHICPHPLTSSVLERSRALLLMNYESIVWKSKRLTI